SHHRPPLFPYTTLFRSRNGLLLWPTASFSTSAKNSAGIRSEEKKPRSPLRDFVASSSDASAAICGKVSPRARRPASRSIISRLRSEEHTSELQSPDQLV